MSYLAIVTRIVSEVGSLIQNRQVDSTNDALAAAGGVVLENVAITTAPQDIAHNLGRPWTEFSVLKQDSANVPYHAGPSANESQFISLKASGAVTVTLRVR